MGKSKSQSEPVPPMLEKLRAMAKSVRTGGKGSVRRKNKVVHHSSLDEDKKVNTFIQQNNCRQIPNIDAVDVIKQDSALMHFDKPKVYLNYNANLTVIQGKSETKTLDEILSKSAAVQHIGKDEKNKGQSKKQDKKGKDQKKGQKKEEPKKDEKKDAGAEKKEETKEENKETKEVKEEKPAEEKKEETKEEKKEEPKEEKKEEPKEEKKEEPKEEKKEEPKEEKKEEAKN